ncbi:XrtA/PEP-CTERM system TPR-repeat protein PrsT [Geobacter sp.]|uniref:XrtA/PEP-CTERM system TPR-repeat protein PrsT n=1 Tax=Geobacter sp. TaxID=46610 RepID=UPI0026071846|nr:XrtA/PEP-CTERM system TPR-repeat protein PrsT [Geobacter sp.]
MYRAISWTVLVIAFLLSVGCGGKSTNQLYAEGTRQLADGKPHGAIVLFKNVLEKDPNFLDARLGLAKAYETVGKYEQAERELLKLRKQNPSRHEVALELAKVYNATDAADKAIGEVRDYVKSHDASAEARELLGVSFALKGMTAEAERSFREALRIEPVRITAKLELAGLLMESGREREQEFRALLDDIIRSDPRNARAYSLLASFEVFYGSRLRALDLYRKEAELDPSNPAPLYREGVLYAESGEFRKAEQVAENMVQRFPKRGEGYRLKGLVAYQKKNYAEAISALQTAVKYAPSVDGYYYLGLSLYNSGELESALSQFRRIIDHKPGFIQARLLTALTLLKQKRIDDSIAEVQKALEYDRRNALAFNILGSACMAKGMCDEGMKYFNKSIEIDPKIVDTHLKKGFYKLSRGRDLEAETDFSAAVRVAPDVLYSRLLLAAFHMRHNNFDKALATLRQGLAGKKDDAVLYNTMAIVMFADKKRSEGIRCLQKAKEVDPTFTPAAFNLAMCYVASGNLDLAVREYQGVLQREPRNFKALLGMAVLSELKGDERGALDWYGKARDTGQQAGYYALAGYFAKRRVYDKALSVLDGALKAFPRDGEAYARKARILAAQKQYKDAIDVLNDMASVAPQQALLLKVGVYAQMKENAKAIEEARRIITLQPNSAFGYLVLSTVYSGQGDNVRAIQEARNGLKVEPGDMKLIMQLGDLYARAGDFAAASDAYERVVKQDPDYAPAYAAQGMLLERMGKKREAAAKYRQALAKGENYVPALNNLAYLYADGYGPREEALRLSLSAFKKEPGNPAILDTFGYALLRNGRSEDARKILEKSVRLLPRDPSVRYHVALACQATGDRSGAVAHLQQALQMGGFPESAQARKLLVELTARGHRQGGGA